MKKLIALVSVLVCTLCMFGCKPDISEGSVTETQKEQFTDVTQKDEPLTVTPLPVTVDVKNLVDCTVAVSLEKGDFYTDENGAVMMDVTVFVYDLYDMADVALIKEGDTILRGKDKVLITSVERNESGTVLINGGLDKGGFELYTQENTVYYERGYSDTKSYYELGKASLPVAPGFVYKDASDLDNQPAIFGAEDFINDAEGIDYYFNASNTSIQIENGYVTAMTRVYRP